MRVVRVTADRAARSDDLRTFLHEQEEEDIIFCSASLMVMGLG